MKDRNSDSHQIVNAILACLKSPEIELQMWQLNIPDEELSKTLTDPVFLAAKTQLYKS